MACCLKEKLGPMILVELVEHEQIGMVKVSKNLFIYLKKDIRYYVSLKCFHIYSNEN